MQAGRARLGFNLATTFMRAEHGVLPIQLEPGLSASEQPTRHRLDVLMFMANLDAHVGLHERFGVEVMLPVRLNRIRASFFRDDELLPGFESIHHRDEIIAGVADLEMMTRIGLVLPSDVRRWNLDLRLGFAQPTGRAEPDPFSISARGEPHQHIFFGNGTFDPRLGLQTRLVFSKVRLVGWAESRVPVTRNAFGYLGSRTLAAGVGVQSSFGLERWTFLAQPEVYFETPATWSSVVARNTGRTSLLATVGAFVAPRPGWQLHAMVSVPYYQTTVSGTLWWPLLGVVGFSTSFDLAPDPPGHGHEHGSGHRHE